jgi:hypothetical protein
MLAEFADATIRYGEQAGYLPVSQLASYLGYCALPLVYRPARQIHPGICASAHRSWLSPFPCRIGHYG